MCRSKNKSILKSYNSFLNNINKMSAFTSKPEINDPNMNSEFPQNSMATNSFPYPECYKDEKRLQVLMAPFRERSVNPENYDSKLKFWQDMIELYCEHKREPKFNKFELQLKFANGDRIPYCLDTVLNEMMCSKKIRLQTEYEYDPENSWKGWALSSFVKKPLAWSVCKIKNSIGTSNESKLDIRLDYVHIELINKFCKSIQNNFLAQHQGKIVHYDALKKLSNESMYLSEDGLKLCLHTLHRRGKIGIHYNYIDKEQYFHLIKIPSKTAASIEITETDHAVHNLQVTQQQLMQQLSDLELGIKINDSKVRDFVREKNRQLAKTYLRKKNLLESNYEKRSLVLHNIETLLNSVDEAQSNGEILNAYKFGSIALQKALSESNLRYDNIDEIICEVRETIETHKEIQDSITNVNLNDTTCFDDDNIEDELKKIMDEVMIGDQVEKKKESSPKLKAKEIEIYDSELLEMLDALELENESPPKKLSHEESSVRN